MPRSTADSVQGMVYGVATGAVFTALQATAAGGLSILTKIGVGAVENRVVKRMYGLVNVFVKIAMFSKKI